MAPTYTGPAMASDVISFARGAPSADILPSDLVRSAAERALTDDWERALSYGKGAGHPGLREWIAQANDVEAEQVMVTNGSLEGAAMLFDHLLGAGDTVIVEQPSYDRTLLQLSRLGVKLVGVRLEDDGVDVGALETALGEDTPRLVHVIPNFHNPAGCTLSDDKRRRLVELAAEHGFTLFEDDPYREVGFAGDPMPTMHTLDRADRVIYASSFSKTVSPGVRVGYLTGPVEAIAALSKRANETYISPNMLAESIVWELCRSGGLAENTETVKRALRERRDTLVEALREHLPEAEFVVPEGGYFLWLTLNDDVDASALLSAAAEERVAFVPGADFMLEGGENSLRFSFASVPPGQIPEGVTRIARALERVRTASPA
jgi:2-aminoadipate transaminase